MPYEQSIWEQLVPGIPFHSLRKMGKYLLCVYSKLLCFPVLFLPGAMLLQGTETYQPAEEFDVFNRYFLSFLI